MAFVKTVPINEATGRTKELYDMMPTITASSEPVNLLLSWSAAPEPAYTWMVSLLTAKAQSGLDDVLYETMEVRLMYLLKCRYVMANHCAILARISGYDYNRIKSYIRSPQTSDLNARGKAVLAFAEKVATRSWEIAKADFDAICKHGFNETQYAGLVFTISALVANAIFPNALGPELDEFSKQYRDIGDW